MSTETHEPAEFRAVLDALNEYLDRELVPLGELAEELSATIEPASVGSLADSDLTPLVPRIQGVLAAAPDFVGFGFAAAAGVMRDGDHYLLWYQRRESGLRRLNLNLAEGDPELYEYFDTEWFTGAERLQAPAIHGPYVDYAGADFLVLTAAVPVLVDGRFVGVAGADIDPHRVEQSLVRMLSALPGEAVVVNDDRSVLAANSARWMPGERVRVHPVKDRESWQAVGAMTTWTGWTLALAPPPPA